MTEKPLTQRQRDALDAMIPGEWMTAEWIGSRMGAKLPVVNRHGNGAVAGSWSGRIAKGLQLASTMQALVRRGLVWEGAAARERHVSEYRRVS